jgi:hypothetical protein
MCAWPGFGPSKPEGCGTKNRGEGRRLLSVAALRHVRPKTWSKT